jgi:predicted O-methyltransferase YrrM
MNSTLSTLISTKRVLAPDGSYDTLDHHINPREVEDLQTLVENTSPKTSLEIGLGYAISALAICDVVQRHGGRHIVIDPFPDPHWKAVGLYQLERAGFMSMVEIHEGYSYMKLPALIAGGCRVDFAFIDGWVTFDYKLVDFFFIDKLLNVGGVAVIRGAEFPSVRKVARFVATNLNYEVVPLRMSTVKPSLKRRTFQKIARKFECVGRYVKPEYLQSDYDLNLYSTLCAFRKIGSDMRPWHHHAEF